MRQFTVKIGGRRTKLKGTIIHVLDFGRDHWSLLMYLETCVVDNGIKGMWNAGRIEKARMRTHPTRHPQHLSCRSIEDRSWKITDGTRLKGWKAGELDRRLPQHDDWDVLEDLEAAGLASQLTGIGDAIALSELGMKTAEELRAWKAACKPMDSFVFSGEPEPRYELSGLPLVCEYQRLSLALLAKVDQHFSEVEKRQIRRVIYSGMPMVKDLPLDPSSSQWNMVMQGASCDVGCPVTTMTILDFTATAVDFFEEVMKCGIKSSSET